MENSTSASPPVFEQIFRNARFAQGGNAFFEGKVKGSPTPQVIWTRKGLQMADSDKHQMLYDDVTGTVSLLIRAIGPGDEGEYTCTALNPYGEAICTVYISPEATKQVKKSRSGNKLTKSSSNKQVQQQQQLLEQQRLQQQQLLQQQQREQYSMQQQQQQQQYSMQQQHQYSMQQQQQFSMQQQSSSMQSYQESSSSMSMSRKEEFHQQSSNMVQQQQHHQQQQFSAKQQIR